jgi:hypothetical protein
VLGHRDFALLFWGQLISAAGTQMQVVAVAWQVLLLPEGARRTHRGLSPRCEASLRGFRPCISVAGMVQLF